MIESQLEFWQGFSLSIKVKSSEFKAKMKREGKLIWHKFKTNTKKKTLKSH